MSPKAFSQGIRLNFPMWCVPRYLKDLDTFFLLHALGQKVSVKLFDGIVQKVELKVKSISTSQESSD